MPAPRKSVGLQEYGLDYATEPAVSRHLARFLRRALENVRSDADLAARVGAAAASAPVELLRPTAVLFNGGVFEAPSFRARVVELLRAWFGADHALKELQSAGLDIAVSRGAAYYGAVRASGKGIAIQAGTSRSYYLGLESPAPAVPGYVPPVKGVCVVPQGTKEGTELELPDREFGLVTGEAVQFRFFASGVRAGDRVGTVVANAQKTLDELPGLSVTLPPLADGDGPGRPGDAASARHRGRNPGAVAAPQAVREALEARLQPARRRVVLVERNQAVLRRDQGLSGPEFAARNPGRGSGCVAGSCVAPGSRG